MVWGYISTCDAGNLHIWKESITTERHIYVQVLEQHVLQSRQHPERPWIFHISLRQCYYTTYFIHYNSMALIDESRC